jgi:hypothetical protein
MLAGMGNPLFQHLVRYLCWLVVDSCLPSVPRENGIDRLVRTTCLKVAHLGLFDYPDWGFFPCLFPQLQGEWQGIIHIVEAQAALPWGVVASPQCLTFTLSLMLNITHLGSNPRKPSSQTDGPPIKPYCLLSSGPQFVHFEVLNSNRKLVGVSATRYLLRCLLFSPATQ